MEINELDHKKGLSFGEDDVDEQEDVTDDESDGDEYVEEKPEELPKSLPEESMADEPEESQPREGKKRDKAQTRINQIQRDRYQALAALEDAKVEIERLRQESHIKGQSAELSRQAAIRLHDDNVNTRLERARQMQIAAFESGDAQAQTDASMEIAAATLAVQESKNWKYKEEYEKKFAEERSRDEAQQQQHSQPTYAPNDILLEDWVERNDWYDPSSENHDSELAAAVSQYANALDYQLASTGYAHQIKSPEYFQHIDKEIRQFVTKRNSQYSNQGRSLNMKTPQGGAYSARNGRSGQGQAQKTGPLDNDQRDMARRMGVTDKQFERSVKWHNQSKTTRHGG